MAIISVPPKAQTLHSISKPSPPQAAAAKVLGLMCGDSPSLATIAVESGAVQSLIVVLSNVRHCPSQQHAARTLSYLVNMFTEVHDTLKECLGADLLEEFLK